MTNSFKNVGKKRVLIQREPSSPILKVQRQEILSMPKERGRLSNSTFVSFFIFFLLLIVTSSLIAQEAITTIVKKTTPSVVLITAYDKDGNPLAQGSGFFISESGDLITNIHVLQGSTRAEVKTSDGKIFPIKFVITEDKQADIIQVKADISKTQIHPLMISRSLPEVGEKVVVIGNPLGLEQTVSDGIVSSVREIPQFGKTIQITAPISPGSSGSAVVNLKGEVIGVATFQMKEGQNLNFVIPSERIVSLKSDKQKLFEEWQKAKIENWLESEEGLYNSGIYFVISGDYEKAIPYFQKAVKKNPNDADSHFLMGYCYGELQRYNEAIDEYKQAIRIKPDDAEAHNNLGVAYDKLGKNNEAIDEYKQAIRIKPNCADAHYNLGLIYSNLWKDNEAIDEFKQAIRIKPDDALAHYNLGNAYFRLRKDNEAIDELKQAIRIKPDDDVAHVAHYNLGLHYFTHRRHNEAISEFKEAIRIKPDAAYAHESLGGSYFLLGKYNEAIDEYKQVIRINPDDAYAHNNLGDAYFRLRKYNEAIDEYKQAIRIKPDHALAHLSLGVSYLIIGNRSSALDEYKILKDLDKDFANELFNLIYQ
jgi:tetratricopeptide (TPR) repeat protein